MPDPSILYLWCARANILLGVLILFSSHPVRLNGHQVWARSVWTASGLCWAVQTAALFAGTGLSSLSGAASTFGLAAAVLFACQAAALNADHREARIRPWLTAVFLILLAWGSLLPEPRHHNSFMAGYLFAVLFFLSRPLSLGLTLFALSGLPDALSEKPGVLAASKQWVFLAAMVFLGGEIAGCYWGFAGWGTTWRWSGNFFFSAMIFVLFMTAFHVPRSIFFSPKSRAWGFFAPLGLIVAATVFSKVMNL